MAEEKFASLTSGLLARKGAAKPAMRRQGYMNPQGDVADDLGWNDMGHEAPHSVGSDDDELYAGVEEPAVRRQLDQLAQDFDSSDYDHGFDGEEIPHGGRAGLSAMNGPADQRVSETEDEPEIDESADYIEDDYAEADEAAEREVPELVEAPELADVPELADQPIARIVPMLRAVRKETPDRAASSHVKARDKVAFTLRLDRERHLKLRLASAIKNRSSQLLVTAALDDFFSAMPELGQLAASASERK